MEYKNKTLGDFEIRFFHLSLDLKTQMHMQVIIEVLGIILLRPWKINKKISIMGKESYRKSWNFFILFLHSYEPCLRLNLIVDRVIHLYSSVTVPDHEILY